VLFFFRRHVHFLGWTSEGPPTPQTPLPVLPPRQKGYQSAPFWTILPSAYSSKPETELSLSYKAKTEIGTPAHAWPTGTHKWLAQPHIASISSEFHCLFHAGAILEVWSELLIHWIDSPRSLHPSACVSDFQTCPRTLLLPNILKRGGNRLDWSWGFRLYIKIMWMWPKKNWKPP